MSVCWPVTVSSEELGNRLQTPTLIGCKFLRSSKFQRPLFQASLWVALPGSYTRVARLLFVRLAVISEALNYNMNFVTLETFSRFFQNYKPNAHYSFEKNALSMRGRFLLLRAWRCPTFTRESALSSAQRRFTVLFGMGRSGTTSLWSSGKTFCHLGLVLLSQDSQFIELISFIELTNLHATANERDFWMRQLGITSLKHFRESKL